MWYILLPLGNLVVIWYIFLCLCQEKSGNLAPKSARTPLFLFIKKLRRFISADETQVFDDDDDDEKNVCRRNSDCLPHDRGRTLGLARAHLFRGPEIREDVVARQQAAAGEEGGGRLHDPQVSELASEVVRVAQGIDFTKLRFG
jgi:hypothetical protein